jgi:hypothetical protein
MGAALNSVCLHLHLLMFIFCLYCIFQLCHSILYYTVGQNWQELPSGWSLLYGKFYLIWLRSHLSYRVTCVILFLAWVTQFEHQIWPCYQRKRSGIWLDKCKASFMYWFLDTSLKVWSVWSVFWSIETKIL